MTTEEAMGKQFLRSLIRPIKDYPKPGIVFQDITPLLAHPEGLVISTELFRCKLFSEEVTKIAACEARGFIFGSALAVAMDVGFIPLRKKGKLPYKVISQDYELEYGTDCIEMHADAVNANDRVVIIDDLLATGGTALAAINLVRSAGATVTSAAFLIELFELGGRDKIEADGIFVHSFLKY